jgi:hypothetical protein
VTCSGTDYHGRGLDLRGRSSTTSRLARAESPTGPCTFSSCTPASHALTVHHRSILFLPQDEQEKKKGQDYRFLSVLLLLVLGINIGIFIRLSSSDSSLPSPPQGAYVISTTSVVPSVPLSVTVPPSDPMPGTSCDSMCNNHGIW